MRKIIVCDLDGTLANPEHRLHYIEGKNKDWKQFFKACVFDKPIPEVIKTVTALADWNNLEIWVITGRSDEVKKETIEWLNDNHIDYRKLIMREKDDRTDDDKLKEGWMEDGVIPKDRIFAIFEDRMRVCRMWRRHQLMVFQVANGDF